MPDPRISQGATRALAWLTTPAVDHTEPMHGPKTPSGAHEAIAMSAAVGVGNSCHSSVLLQQREPISDSPGIAFGGIELVPGLDVLLEATSSLDAPLTLATLNHWHQRLFAGGPDGLRASRIGELRDGARMKVLSGAIGREPLHVEAPPRDQLDWQLEAFLG